MLSQIITHNGNFQSYIRGLFELTVCLILFILFFQVENPFEIMAAKVNKCESTTSVCSAPSKCA